MQVPRACHSVSVTPGSAKPLASGTISILTSHEGLNQLQSFSEGAGGLLQVLLQQQVLRCELRCLSPLLHIPASGSISSQATSQVLVPAIQQCTRTRSGYQTLEWACQGGYSGCRYILTHAA